MPPQFIFTMKDLRKITPQGKEILKGIWLSFYPDAKIGVLGANGAGKSTLLRIMADVDKDFAGEAFPAEGTRIGYLPQEPVLDPSKNVLQHVEEAVAEKRKILARYEEISANYSDETADEFARLQDQIDAQNLWDLDKQVEIAMDALRHMLAFEGMSQVVWFEGNHQDYEADRKCRLGVEADQPHRIKYRKLTRSSSR